MAIGRVGRFAGLRRPSLSSSRCPGVTSPVPASVPHPAGADRLGGGSPRAPVLAGPRPDGRRGDAPGRARRLVPCRTVLVVRAQTARRRPCAVGALRDADPVVHAALWPAHVADAMAANLELTRSIQAAHNGAKPAGA